MSCRPPACRLHYADVLCHDIDDCGDSNGAFDFGHQGVEVFNNGTDSVGDRPTDTQYLSIRNTEWLEEAGIETSVGSRGDSYDITMAESVIGLFKAEVIRHEAPWGLKEVEFVTLEWGDWTTTSACLSRSATSHRRSPNRRTMLSSAAAAAEERLEQESLQ